MSDANYDVLRLSGRYPFKGWGWQSDEYQRGYISNALSDGRGFDTAEPWIVDKALEFGLMEKTDEIVKRLREEMGWRQT